MTAITPEDIARRPVRWIPREPPLEPGVVYARGPIAAALVARMLARDARKLEGLRGVATGEGLVVTGPEESLPWCDGVLYLGRASESSTLWLPCRIQPDVPLDLYERAVRTRTRAKGSIAVIPEHGLVLGLRRAETVDTEWLVRASRARQ